MDDREFEVDVKADGASASASSMAVFGVAVNTAENLATIDEAEASKLTGLSGPTLRQLVEVGSIDGQRGEDGSYSFEFRSIRSLVPLDDREAMGASYESRRNGGSSFDGVGREGGGREGFVIDGVGEGQGSGQGHFGSSGGAGLDGDCEDACNEALSYNDVLSDIDALSDSDVLSDSDALSDSVVLSDRDALSDSDALSDNEVLSDAAEIDIESNVSKGVTSIESETQGGPDQITGKINAVKIDNDKQAINLQHAQAVNFQARDTNANIDTTPSQGNDSRSAELNDLEARLLKVLRWQDNIIAVKDEQIAALQSEISWLRLRVEKFEDQSDRDRVLLMSQNQTIQQLAKLDRNKRSLMRSTMEFLGLVPKEEVRTLE